MVKKSSYSVLALFCQYSHACHDEFRRALVSVFSRGKLMWAFGVYLFYAA